MKLSTAETARLFGVSEKTVERWVEEESLPAHRLNDVYHFNRAELVEWARSHGAAVPADLFDAPAPGRPPAVALGAALEAGGVFHGLEGADKHAVLRAMVGCMPLPPEVDREFLLSILVAREALASTGLGDGVAVPHARSPVVLRVPRPVATLCFTARPVAFGAPDGKPVSALFALVCPNPKLHLQLLSRLAFALKDEAFRAAVQRQAPAAEVVALARRVDGLLEGPGAP